MRNRFNKLLKANSATIFIFLYGIIIQIVSFPVIYIYGAALQDALPESVKIIDKFIFMWFFVPIISVFSILIANMQIRERKKNHEKWKTPLVGLILNAGWLICYLILIYFVFVVKMPNLFE